MSYPWYIYNETLSGVVNGVNKVFTSANPIASIEDIRLGNVTTALDTGTYPLGFNGNTVYLSNAPTTILGSPVLDYFWQTATPATVGTTVTLDTLRKYVYGILNELDNSGNYSTTSRTYPLFLVDEYINNAQNAILAGSIIRQGSNETDAVVKGVLPFLIRYMTYKSVMDTTLSGATTVNAATISVGDTSNFYAVDGMNYRLWIDQNIVSATGVTATSFTGCSGVTFAHPAGKNVAQVYDLPEDFSQAIRLIYDGIYQLTPKDYRKVYSDLKNQPVGLGTLSPNQNGYYRDLRSFYSVNTPYYCIIDAKYLLPSYNFQNNRLLMFEYEAIPSVMVASSDLVTVPDRWSKVTIPQMAVSMILYNRGEEDRAGRLNNQACDQAFSMYRYYNDSVNEQPFEQRVQTAKDGYYNF